jgi:hypothetical protein
VAPAVSLSLHELIDREIRVGGIGGQVLLPSVLEVRETVRVAGVRGLRISGLAPLASELVWNGPADIPMFDIDCCQDIFLEHFSISIAPGTTLLAAAWMQNGRGGSGEKAMRGLESSRVSWNNVVVRGQGNLDGGFHVKLFDARKDIKNDHHSFHAVVVSGYHQAAFTLEGRNAKNLSFDRCQCVGMAAKRRVGQYAVDTGTVPGQGAAFHWSRGVVGGNAMADFRIGDRNHTIGIEGVYSEKSGRLLVMPPFSPGGDAACPVLLENYRFAAATPELVAEDREVVQCEAAGPLTMIACKLGSAAHGQQLHIRYAPPTAPGAFTFIGNAIANDGNGHVFTASPPTMAYQHTNLGYRHGGWRPLGDAPGPHRPHPAELSPDDIAPSTTSP